MDISVIIPVYNVENYLTKCLDGVLAQTHKNFEVILINDGSTDRSGEICDEYRSRDNRINVIHQKNRGVSIARNIGLSLAEGTYIYFCDPDDYIESTLLEDNFNLAQSYKANMVVFGYYNEVQTKKNVASQPIVAPVSFLESKEEFRNSYSGLHKKNIMFTLWNKIYKKSYLLENNCYFENQKVGEDSIFNYKVYKNIDKVYINDKLYYHYITSRPDSAINVYRSDRFELRYETSLELERLIETWGYMDSYKELILNDWLKTLYVGVNNLFFAHCPLNEKEKKQQIMLQIKNTKIKYLLENLFLLKLDNFFAVTVSLLKFNHVNLFFLFYKFKMNLKDGILKMQN